MPSSPQYRRLDAAQRGAVQRTYNVGMELRCVCLNLTFRGLLSYARRHDITEIEPLMAATGCSTRCGSCKPYIAEMLRTGEVPTAESIQIKAEYEWGE